MARAMLWFAVFAVVSFACSAAVWASKTDLQNAVFAQQQGAARAPVNITLGKADVIRVPGSVSDVLVANPSIVDVMAVQSNSLYVVGLRVGDTNLIVLDSAGDVIKRVDIHVSYDLQAIQSFVDDLFPDENVRIGAIHDQIVLTGRVSTPDIASRITNVVGHYVGDLQDKDGIADDIISNLLEVRGEQQVMLQVKIMEASRSVLKELGIQTDFNNPDATAATTIFGTTRPSSVRGGGNSLTVGSGGLGLTRDPAAAARFLTDTGIAGIGDLGIFLRALEEENLLNILAEPNLTAVSGETAGFLAGGEFPVPVGRDNVGNVVVEFREFGVSLNFRPVVLSDRRISLKLNTEVSSLDFSSAVVLADLSVPGLDIRRTDTTVEIPSGDSLMIAGLLQSEAVKGMVGLPGISGTPVLGDLVKSDSFRRDETELLVVVTPYLVEPYSQKNNVAPVPAHRTNPLANAFASNLRRSFGFSGNGAYDGDERFGYLLD